VRRYLDLWSTQALPSVRRLLSLPSTDRHDRGNS
jgi:hypothetical protein